MPNLTCFLVKQASKKMLNYFRANKSQLCLPQAGKSEYLSNIEYNEVSMSNICYGGWSRAILQGRANISTVVKATWQENAGAIRRR